MMYGNRSMGYSYSPDTRKDKVNHNNLRTPFLGASGNKQNGYYYSATPTYSNKPTAGYYDGAGRYQKIRY